MAGALNPSEAWGSLPNSLVGGIQFFVECGMEVCIFLLATSWGLLSAPKGPLPSPDMWLSLYNMAVCVLKAMRISLHFAKIAALGEVVERVTIPLYP